jgi:hypothetical protein
MDKEDLQAFNKGLKNIKKTYSIQQREILMFFKISSRESKKVKINLGGYFQSVNILEVNLLIQRDNLKNRKWKKPTPAFKGTSYKFYNCLIKVFNPDTKLLTSLCFYLLNLLLRVFSTTLILCLLAIHSPLFDSLTPVLSLSMINE